MELTLNNVTEQQLEEIAQSIASRLFPGAFIALFGDLGAGKTAFARHAAKALGIEDIQAPPSPSYGSTTVPFPCFTLTATALRMRRSFTP